MSYKGINNFARLEKIEMGNIGTGIVDFNKNSDNFFMIFPLIQTGGDNPIELSLIYNQNNKSVKGDFGNGVKLSFYNRVQNFSNKVEIERADGGIDSYLEGKGFYNAETELTVKRHVEEDDDTGPSYEYDVIDKYGNRMEYRTSYMYPSSIIGKNGDKITYDTVSKTIANGKGDTVSITPTEIIHKYNGVERHKVKLGYTNGYLTTIEHYKGSKKIVDGKINYLMAEIVVKDIINNFNVQFDLAYMGKVTQVKTGYGDNYSGEKTINVVYETALTKVTYPFNRSRKIFYDKNDFPIYEVDENNQIIASFFDNTSKKLLYRSSPINIINCNNNLFNKKTTETSGTSVVSCGSKNSNYTSFLGSWNQQLTNSGTVTFKMKERILASDVVTAFIWGYSTNLDANQNIVKTELIVGDKISTTYFTSDTQFDGYVLKVLGITSLKTVDEVLLRFTVYGSASLVISGTQVLKKDFGSFYNYDSNGNMIDVSQGAGKVVIDYDENQCPKTIMGKNFSTATYEYDDLGNVTRMTTGYDVIVNNAYQAGTSNLTKRTIQTADGTKKLEITKEYSEDGRNLLSETDELGNKTSYYYDNLNHIKTVSNVLGAGVYYEYNELDSIVSMLLSKERESVKCEYSYDDKFRVSEIKLESGMSYKFSYDSYGNLYKITSNGVILYEFSYNSVTQNLEKLKYGNSKDYYIFSYSDKNYLNRISYWIDAKQTSVLRYQLQYDKLGRLETVTNLESGTESVYSYDNDNRVINVETNGMSIDYRYDNLGEVNYLSYEDADASIQHSYDSINRSKDLHLTTVYEELRRKNYLTAFFRSNNNLMNRKYSIQPTKQDGSNISVIQGREKGIYFARVMSGLPLSYKMDMPGKCVEEAGSICFWFRTTDTATKKYLFSAKNATGNSFIGVYALSKRLYLEVTDVNNNKKTLLSTDDVFKDNEWTFFGLSWLNRNDELAKLDLCEYRMALNDKIKEFKQTNPRIVVDLGKSPYYNIGHKYDGATLTYQMNLQVACLLVGDKEYLFASDITSYYERTRNDIILAQAEAKVTEFSLANLYTTNKAIKNQFDIFPLHNSVLSLKNTEPERFDLRIVGDLELNRTFEYNASISRYTYVASGDTLQYSLNNSKSGTVFLRAYIKEDKTKQYFFHGFNGFGSSWGLYRGTNNQLILEFNQKEYSTGLTVPSKKWHSLALSWNDTTQANSMGGIDLVETLRVYLNGQIYENKVSNFSFKDATSLMVGRNNASPSFPLFGNIECLAISNTFTELTTLDTLSKELLGYTKIQRFNELGMWENSEIMHGGAFVLNRCSWYKFNKNCITNQIDIEEFEGNDFVWERGYDIDQLGNVTRIGDTSFGPTTFEYDFRGFLIKENDKTFTYDKSGNITKAGNTVFSYDTLIKDRLIKVGDKEIKYGDDYLKPVSYNGNTYTFEGKKLTKVNDLEFKYDVQGLRLSKGNIKYYYNGDKLITEKASAYRLDFLYDENGMLYGFIYNQDKIYFYIRDYLQNILGIVDCNGNLVVKYKCDVWGNHTGLDQNGNINQSSNFIGNINPFRYKGYYYDRETNMFYCKSRYYVPEWCRWLNGDMGEEFNLYAYGNNNPVNYQQRPVSSGGLVISSSISVGGSSVSTGGFSVGGNLGDVGNHPSAPRWVSTAVGAFPDFILGMKYLAASGMHSKFAYATNTRYMYPIMGGTWRWFGKSSSSFGTMAQGTFKQILTGDARAGFGAIAKSVSGVVGLNALVNFGFNLYENNWQVDSAMLVDTAIDTAIGVGSYYLAAGSMSLVTAGLVSAGVAMPGIIVVGGVVLLSIGFEWAIREIFNYHQ